MYKPADNSHLTEDPQIFLVPCVSTKKIPQSVVRWLGWFDDSIDIREVSGLLLDHRTVRVLRSLSALEESQKTAKKLARPDSSVMLIYLWS